MHIRWKDVLSNSGLLNGLKFEELPEALSLLEAQQRSFKKGEMIVRFREPLKRAVMLLEGVITCTMYEPLDCPFVIKHVRIGEAIALPGCCMPNTLSPVEITAATDCTVLMITLNAFLQGENGNSKVFFKIGSNLIREISYHARILNSRLRIVTHKGIRDRIRLYLNDLPKDKNGYVRIPLTMTELANYLHIDKSAMYRTIRELRAEGVLEWERNKVKVFNDNFGELSDD